jgi:hypothetical protein
MRHAAPAVLLALLAAGCAGPGPGTPPPPPATAAPTPAATTAGTLTVDGVVERGVEPGCLVLRAGARSYLLQGAAASGAPIAVPVRVSGALLTGVASYCQQGTPLEVASISRR